MWEIVSQVQQLYFLLKFDQTLITRTGIKSQTSVNLGHIVQLSYLPLSAKKSRFDLVRGIAFFFFFFFFFGLLFRFYCLFLLTQGMNT